MSADGTQGIFSVGVRILNHPEYGTTSTHPDGRFELVVNGGGHIDREYGLGRGRIDLLVRWPYRKADGQRALQRRALEMKVWRAGKADPTKEGLKQLDGYLDQLRLAKGVLVIFDRRREAAGIAKKARFETAVTPKGRTVTLLRA